MMSRSGFTLVEVVVVLAIVGIVTAVAVPSLTSALRRSPHEEAVTAVVTTLARARALAVRSGAPVRAIVTAEGRVADPGGPVSLPAGARVEPIGAELVFYPTGLSSGARWRVHTPGAPPTEVIVDPIDAAIRMDS